MKMVRVKCNEYDTMEDPKKLVAMGTRADKIRIQKWYNITLKDDEIHDGMGLELYYN